MKTVKATVGLWFRMAILLTTIVVTSSQDDDYPAEFAPLEHPETATLVGFESLRRDRRENIREKRRGFGVYLPRPRPRPTFPTSPTRPFGFWQSSSNSLTARAHPWYPNGIGSETFGESIFKLPNFIPAGEHNFPTDGGVWWPDYEIDPGFSAGYRYPPKPPVIVEDNYDEIFGGINARQFHPWGG